MVKELIDSVVAERGFRTEFPASLLDEAEQIAKNPPGTPGVDYRHHPLVTIDDTTAQDYDDAVGCRRLPDGNILLTVAIADVSAFVQPDSALDNEARQRGNSVYLPDRVLPMLPPILSNDACSLKAECERRCVICEMHVHDGIIRQYCFLRGTIKSVARMTYTEAAEVMENNEAEAMLTLLAEFCLAARRQRQKRGAMLLEKAEKFCFVDANGDVQSGEKKRNIAHWAIEEAMLAANRCAAAFLIRHKRAALHRIHRRPSTESVQQLANLLKTMDIYFPTKPSAADFGNALKFAEERAPELADALTPVVLGTMSRAEYSPNEKVGHFGLSCPHYLHFTSPIRRYPDLLTHRAIVSILADEKPPADDESLSGIGAHCSETEVRADKAGWECRQKLLCLVAQQYIGCEYTGYVSGGNEYGLFINLPDLGIDGFIRIASLPDYWRYTEKTKQWQRRRDGKTITLAEPLNVLLQNVIPEKGRVNLSITKMD